MLVIWNMQLCRWSGSAAGVALSVGSAKEIVLCPSQSIICGGKKSTSCALDSSSLLIAVSTRTKLKCSSQRINCQYMDNDHRCWAHDEDVLLQRAVWRTEAANQLPSFPDLSPLRVFFGSDRFCNFIRFQSVWFLSHSEIQFCFIIFTTHRFSSN